MAEAKDRHSAPSQPLPAADRSPSPPPFSPAWQPGAAAQPPPEPPNVLAAQRTPSPPPDKPNVPLSPTQAMPASIDAVPHVEQPRVAAFSSATGGVAMSGEASLAARFDAALAAATAQSGQTKVEREDTCGLELEIKRERTERDVLGEDVDDDSREDEEVEEEEEEEGAPSTVIGVAACDVAHDADETASEVSLATSIAGSTAPLLGSQAPPQPGGVAASAPLGLPADSVFSREDSMDTPMLRSSLPVTAPGPLSPSGGSKGLPRPMRGDLPADLLEEVPGEPPTTVPMSSNIVMPAGAASRVEPLPHNQTDLVAPVAPLASSPFTPPLRSATSSSSRAEEFLGAPVYVPRAPEPDPAGCILESARWLIRHRRLEAALRLLQQEDEPGSGSVDAAILRVRCFVALRRYSTAADTLAQLVAAADSAAFPFDIRVLDAHLPFLLDAADAPQALWQLQELARGCRCTGTSGNAGMPAEKTSALLTFADMMHLLRTLSRLALAAGYSEVATARIQEALADSECAGDALRQSRLLSLLGRHHIAGGDCVAAGLAFDTAHNEQPESATAFLDAGYMAMTHGNYAAAQSQFAQASSAACKAIDVAGGLASASEDLLDAYVAAENNLAVCRLYTQELRQGIKGLEAFIRRDPVLLMRPSVAQNLSSLYEFTTDTSHRRATLREVAVAFQLEDLDPRIFEQPGA